MQFLQLFPLASLAIAIYAQTCPDTEITFLFDQSENALAASTNDPKNSTVRFHILREQVTTALKNSRLLNTPSYVNIRVGGYGYSSSLNITSVIPPGSSPTEAIESLTNGLFLISNGGSWTYRGLQGITTGPSYANNRLIVVSSQGSAGSTTRRLLAQQEAERVRSLGWNLTVIAAAGKNIIDFQELTAVNNNQFPIVVNDTTNTTDPKSYRLLASELNKIFNSMCPITPTCPNADLQFLFDQSENAWAASTSESNYFTMKFHILQEQVSGALRNSRILNTPRSVTIRVAGYGYSSGENVTSVIPLGSSPAAAVDSLAGGLLLMSNHGGSWTYRGLHGITSGPIYANNRLIVVSSQGSGNTTRRLLAQQEAERVRSLGWNITVIAVKGIHPIDLQELTAVNNNQSPIVINDTTNTTDPKSYRLLQPELDNIINSLCNVSPVC